MLELEGQFNTCKVFTDDAVDNETISQIIGLLNLQSIAASKVRIMPDCHAGKGCVIGTTMTLTDSVIPNLVGVDIGCGMRVIRLQEKDIDFEKLDQVIRTHIPSGHSVHQHAIAKSKINKIIAPINIQRDYQSLGTLGGGNHFIEIDKDSNDDLWLVIHTGSRYLGMEVCKYYQDKGYYKIKENDIGEKIQQTVKKLRAEGKDYEIDNTIKILKMQEPKFYRDFAQIMKENDSLPIYNLVFFGLYQGEKGICCYTDGMEVFNKDEMEILNAEGDPKDIRDFLSMIANYVISCDVILQDGETIGFTEDDKHKIVRSKGVSLEGDTLKISYEQE